MADQLLPDKQEELLRELQLQALRHEVQRGVDSAERGELTPAKDFLAKLRRRAESRLDESI